MSVQFIDTIHSLEEFLSNAPTPMTGPPAWYIDLEGDNLSRQGTLSLMTILIHPRGSVIVIDIKTLAQSAFNTLGKTGNSLKSILESKEVVKVFFDIRNDSDALYSHFGIDVNGIQDVQLMELASRTFNRRCINGLAKCIERDSGMGFEERRRWQEVKEAGRRLFAPELGGSYSVFDERPLTPQIVEYCAQDVQLLPILREVYRAKLCDAWWSKIEAETQARIVLSQSTNYNGKGRHMALGPSSWIHWVPSAAEKCSRALLDQENTGLLSRPEGANPPGTEETAPAQHVARTASIDNANCVNGGPGSIDTPISVGESSAARAPRRIWRRGGIVAGSRRHWSPAGSDEDYANSPTRDSGWHSDDEDGYRSESPRDLTACDKECGYCGHCMY